MCRRHFIADLYFLTFCLCSILYHRVYIKSNFTCPFFNCIINCEFQEGFFFNFIFTFFSFSLRPVPWFRPPWSYFVYSHYFPLLRLTIASERSLQMSQHKEKMWELLCKNKNTCLDLRTVISKHAMHVIKRTVILWLHKNST